MQRDSGGPLLCKRQDIWYLTGKTSMTSCEISNKLLWNAKLNRFMFTESNLRFQVSSVGAMDAERQDSPQCTLTFLSSSHPGGWKLTAIFEKHDILY